MFASQHRKPAAAAKAAAAWSWSATGAGLGCRPRGWHALHGRRPRL